MKTKSMQFHKIFYLLSFLTTVLVLKTSDTKLAQLSPTLHLKHLNVLQKER